MPKLPDKFSLGGASIRQPRRIAQLQNPGAVVDPTGAGLEAVGDAVTNVAVKIQKEQDAADAIKADAHHKKRLIELNRELATDGDFNSHGKRFQEGSAAVAKEAADMIRNPSLRKRFMVQADLRNFRGHDAIIGRSRTRSRNADRASMSTSLDTQQQIYTDPNSSSEEKADAMVSMKGYIEAGKRSGLNKTRATEALKNKYIHGSQKADALIQALKDPKRLKAELEAAGSHHKVDVDRPIITNDDGSVSTERSMSVSFGMKENGVEKHQLIPTIVDGKHVSQDEAIKLHKAGKNPSVGTFDSLEAAEAGSKARSAAIMGKRRYGKLTNLERAVLISKADGKIASQDAQLRQLVKDDLASIRATGKGLDIENDRLIAAVGAEKAERIAVEKIFAKKFYDNMNDANSISIIEMEERLGLHKPKSGQEDFVLQQELHNDMIREYDRILNLRDKDAATAVREIPEVALAYDDAKEPPTAFDEDGEEFIPPGNPAKTQAAIKASLDAQARIGIAPLKQRILSLPEANKFAGIIDFAGRLGGREMTREENQALEATVHAVKSKYGQYADQALGEIISSVARKKIAASATGAILRKLVVDQEIPSQTQARKLDEDEDTRRAEEASQELFPTKGNAAAPAEDDPEELEARRALPSTKAILTMVGNPELIPDFVEKFGREAAERVVGRATVAKFMNEKSEEDGGEDE